MFQYIKNIYHLIFAVFSNIWFGFPSKKLTVIGVTGTDGKTTTVNLIYHILNQAGYSVSMISSVGARIGGKDYDIGFHVTTPSSFSLQGFINKIVKEGSKYLILEVTSHAIDQHRIWGIDFEIGVLTNVTLEHLDYHKTYENYVNTKAKLLQMAKIAIINKDDKSFTRISSKLKVKSSKLSTYGISKSADINPENFPFKTDLIGEFNKYNILAAISVCKTLGLSDSDIQSGISSFKPPIGRTETVYKNNFSIMIDFAHTPNALEQILSSVSKENKGKIVHVFGSAGERDFKKRPLMGAVSSKYSDIIVLTGEDPRSESVEKIIEEIESGIKNSHFRSQNLYKIPNRQEAITAGIKMAKKGDLVLITGKGHEKSMNYGQGEKPWSEYEAVKNALGERSGN